MVEKRRQLVCPLIQFMEVNNIRYEPNVDGFALSDINVVAEHGLIEATVYRDRIAHAYVTVIPSDRRVKLSPPRQYNGTSEQWKDECEASLRGELSTVAHRNLDPNATEFDLIMHLKQLGSKLV